MIRRHALAMSDQAERFPLPKASMALETVNHPELGRPNNAVLAALPEPEYRRLLPSLERVELPPDTILHRRGGIIRHAIFPEQGLISLITSLEDGSSVEVAVIGNRGFAGIPLAFESVTCPYEAFVQIAGSAIRMKADAFMAEFQRGGVFQTMVLDYIRCRMFMMSQYLACNRIHELNRRLPRLLLRIHDEVGLGEFSMTHERMSQLLGAARSEVAKHAALLREAGLIAYQRCNVKIVDRKGLEAASCECYSLIAQEFSRVFPKRKEPKATREYNPQITQITQKGKTISRREEK